MHTTDLIELGWGNDFEAPLTPYTQQGWIPARVGREDRQHYLLLTATGEHTGKVSGRFMHEAISKQDYPAVGDWVAAECKADGSLATVHAVLPRRSCFTRHPPGNRTEAQVVAANVDTVFIVCGLDGGRAFNERRIERFMTLSWESGASPVVILNKSDTCDSTEAFIERTQEIAPGAPVHAISAREGDGIDTIRAYIKPTRSLALIGPSGVGKSTLVNTILGTERQATGDVRQDDKQGRHTTVRRELIMVPGGGILIDTPGMREMQLWGDEVAVGETFADIEALAHHCRFNDCSHEHEPGCAIQDALAADTLDAERYNSFLKLQREMAHHASRKSQRARLEQKAQGKQLSKHIRHVIRGKRR